MSREKSMKKAEELWPLLIKKAMNHETVTYAEARDHLEYPTCLPVIHGLWNITDYCDAHKLPALTAIVISARTGTCGKGFTDVKGTDVESMQKEVFFYNKWKKVEPFSFSMP